MSAPVSLVMVADADHVACFSMSARLVTHFLRTETGEAVSQPGAGHGNMGGLAILQQTDKLNKHLAPGTPSQVQTSRPPKQRIDSQVAPSSNSSPSSRTFFLTLFRKRAEVRWSRLPQREGTHMAALHDLFGCHGLDYLGFQHASETKVKYPS